ncbi:hypothetical protein JL721_1773 [Aureococcus anophagefferens]|nr:hypothetical protein JL721_1773 [Aureococcus anophagefferens]
MLSPRHRCAFGDDGADGYVRGEGVAFACVSATASAATAFVESTAVNQDGRSNGLTAPNPAAQARMLRAAVGSRRKLDAGFAEAHGTARLGDPIELDALGRSLREGPGAALATASVKSNLGHLECAAAQRAAGLARRPAQAPRSLHAGSTPSSTGPRTAFVVARRATPRRGSAAATASASWHERRALPRRRPDDLLSDFPAALPRRVLVADGYDSDASLAAGDDRRAHGASLASHFAGRRGGRGASGLCRERCLGEISACVCCDVLSLRAALAFAAGRGRALDESQGAGAMVACRGALAAHVLGLFRDRDACAAGTLKGADDAARVCASRGGAGAFVGRPRPADVDGDAAAGPRTALVGDAVADAPTCAAARGAVDRLLDAADALPATAHARYVVGFGLDGPRGALRGVADVAEARAAALLRLFGRLATSTRRSSVVVLTRGVHPDAWGAPDGAGVWGGALWGAATSARVELAALRADPPAIACVDSGRRASSKALRRDVQGALSDDVRLADGSRTVARLRPGRRHHAASALDVSPPAGVLVITGGTGALGLAVTRWLLELRARDDDAGAAAAATRICLLSRSGGASPAYVAGRGDLDAAARRAGASVEALAVDVGDDAALRLGPFLRRDARSSHLRRRFFERVVSRGGRRGAADARAGGEPQGRRRRSASTTRSGACSGPI